MHPTYPNVFTPIKLGPVEIENRFYFAPHGVALTIGAEPSNDFPYYSAERVRGGCGLVINSLNVYGKVAGFGSPYPEAHLPSFQAMAEAVHREGGKIFGQLWYFWEATGSWLPLTPPRPGLTPSPVQLFTSYYSSHALRRDEMRTFVEAYRAVGRQPAACGLRRRRGARLARDAARAVHVAVLQPADRRVRRQPREPAPARLRVPRGRARRRRATGWRSACASTATSCCPAATGCRRRPSCWRRSAGRASWTSSISTSRSSRCSSGSACRRCSSTSTPTSRTSRRCAARSATCRC